MRKIGFGSIKKVGFDVNGAVAKLVADFTTGTYKASGVDKTFAEVFTFSRAGKAWLVKDTGLVEYAVDVPRFDDGLLIEQSATNFILHSQNMSNSYWDKWGCTTVGNIVKQDTTENVHNIRTASRSVPQYNHTRSQTVLLKPNGNRYLGVISDSGRSTFATVVYDTVALASNPTDAASITFKQGTVTISRQGDYLLLSAVVIDTGSWNTISNSVVSIQFYKEFNSTYSSRQFIGDGVSSFEVLAVDAKIESHASSLIPTTTSPVTRPADYIQTPITGTTVTGDWDSTLQLSIENGQLVHTGYGRIRSLEIN